MGDRGQLRDEAGRIGGQRQEAGMRRLGVGLLVVGLVVGMAGVSEASVVGNVLGGVWGYLTAPVNCLAKVGVDVVKLLVDGAVCLMGNLNPANLLH